MEHLFTFLVGGRLIDSIWEKYLKNWKSDNYELFCVQNYIYKNLPGGKNVIRTSDSDNE